MKYKIGDIYVDVALDAIDIDIIRGKTPVKTGALRDHFTLDPDGNIINPLDYADDVELGTVHMPGRFMVTQSVPEIGERLAERIAEQMDRNDIIKLPVIEVVVK